MTRRRTAVHRATAPLAVELFSGTAGATAAFRMRDWDVITIDNDPRHNPTICADLSRAVNWPSVLGGRPVQLLWCSPPCTEFSDANPKRPEHPDMALMFAAFAAVNAIRPR